MDEVTDSQTVLQFFRQYHSNDAPYSHFTHLPLKNHSLSNRQCC